MRTRVAHALRFANTSCTRRTELSVNPQFTTYKPRNSVQTTGATANDQFKLGRLLDGQVLWAGTLQDPIHIHGSSL